MLRLEPDDFRGLVRLLANQPMLATQAARESVLKLAGLSDLVPQFDLTGPSAVALPLLVDHLARYGRVTYDHEALGRFLSANRDYLGMEDRRFVDGLIERYGMMAPSAEIVEIPDWKSPITNAEVLEKIVGENTLRPIAFLSRALAASKAVCLVAVNHGHRAWTGSGFLVSPRLVLTNHHVLPSRASVDAATFRFNYQQDANGNAELAKEYRPVANGLYLADESRDYALVEVAGSPGDEWGVLTLMPALPDDGARVNIIQHPSGLPKQISMQNNFVRYADPRRVQYVTSTLPGSSGSPVFSDDWLVLALHHAGGWLQQGDQGPYHFRNEGIALGAILDTLPEDVVNELTIA